MVDPTPINFKGRGANVVGSLGEASMVQDMPVAWANFDELNESTKGCEQPNQTDWDAISTAGTWEFWIKQLVGGGYQDASIFHKNLAWTFGANAGREYGYRVNLRGYQPGETHIPVPVECTIPRGAAVHCCATYDGTTTKLYLNGSLVSSSTAMSGDLDVNTAYLYFAKNGASLPQGALWDGRLWGRALPQSEIQYNFANRPTTTGSLYDNTDLLGWWPYNGDADDISGKGFDFTESANTEYSAVGYNLKQIGSGSVSGTATISGGTWNLRDSSYATFNGSSDYITIADAGDSLAGLDQPKSMALWCRFDSVQTGQLISRGSNDYELYMHSGDTWGVYWGTKYVTMTGIAIPSNYLGEWTHVVATLDDSTSPPTQRFYINGVLEDTSAVSGTPAYSDDSDLEIGRRTGGTQNFSGDIFDVRLMAYQMCDEEVAALYAGWADPAAVGWWLGIGASAGATGSPQITDSTTVEDQGNANNNGTMSSNLWVNPTLATEDHVIIGTYPNTLNPINLPTISAPRGTWNFCHNVSANEATLRNYGNFIHNNGAFSPGNETHSNNGSSRFTTKFYDVIRDQTGQFSLQACIAWDSGVNLAAAVTSTTQTEWVVDNAAIFTAGDYIVMTEESATAEVIRIASIASNTLTVERGQWGLAPSTYLSAASIYYKPSNNVEGSLISTAGETRLWGAVNDQPTALVLGTPTTAGTVSSSTAYGLQLGSSGGGMPTGSCAGLVGVNTLNPVELLGTPPQVDWQPTDGDVPNTYIFYGNITTAVSNDFDTTAEDTNLKLVGDCQFGDVTIDTGDTLDLNGQRMECSIMSAWNGVLSGTTANSLLVTAGTTAGTFCTAGANGNLSGTNIMCNNTLSATSYYTMNVAAAKGPNNALINIDNASYTLKPGGNDDQNMDSGAFIIGAGTFDSYNDGNNNWNLNDVTIASGGALSLLSDSMTIAGDFNMAGGFIGQGALAFNGTNEEMETSANFDEMADTDKFTFETWVKTDDDGALMSRRASWGVGNIMLYIGSDGTVRIAPYGFTVTNVQGADGILDGSYGIIYNIDMRDDKWHHYVATYDTVTLKLYVDGKLKVTGDATDGISTQSTGAFLGARGGADFFDGKMARASFWNNALTETEIRQMMFYDWAAVSGSSIDQTDCIAWYEFSDAQNATTITDMSGSGSTGTLTATDAWAGPGTFNKGTSTLVFDKAGTCNFYGSQDGSTDNNIGGLTITNGTTLNYYSIDEDLHTYGLLINSGTLWGNRAFQYHNTDMPIVDASSDLTVGGNYFYYMPTSSAILSGAATTYHHLTTTAVSGNTGILYMQGDFTTDGTTYPYSDGEIHLNGHKGTINYFRSYGSGNIIFEAGSQVNLTSTNGFYLTDGGSESYITAEGEASVICATDVAGTAEPNYIEVANDAALVAPVGAVTMTAWVKPDSAALAAGTSYLQPVGKINAYRMFINGQGAATPRGELSLQLQDVGNLTGPSTVSGNVWTHLAATYDGSNIRIYYNGIEVTSSAATGDIYQADPRDLWIGKFATPNRYFPGSITDVRLYSTGLTAGNCLTLASINPATNVSGAIYADPDNDFGALGWWKCGATASGTLDATNYGTSGSAIDGSISGSAKSGFVTVTGSAGFNSINRPYQDMTLTNIYISGMADIVVGETFTTTPNVNTDSTLITKGTVVLN